MSGGSKQKLGGRPAGFKLHQWPQWPLLLCDRMSPSPHLSNDKDRGASFIVLSGWSQFVLVKHMERSLAHGELNESLPSEPRVWGKEVSSTGRATESCRERQTDGIGPKKNPKWCPTLDTWPFRKGRRVPCDVSSRVPSTAHLSLAGRWAPCAPSPPSCQGLGF